MVPRQTAALVLVGWYLLAPPALKGGGGYDPDAPLNRWINEGSYDSAADCEAFRTSIIEAASGHIAKQQAHYIQSYFLLSVCIASDDPRLKQK
jgi:hypothetical protein